LYVYLINRLTPCLPAVTLSKEEEAEPDAAKDLSDCYILNL